MLDKKAQTRDRILQAARAAVIQRGPLDPSVNDVMGAAGLTVGGFYSHFENKDALMLEAFRQLLGQRRNLLEAVDPALKAQERRQLMARYYLSRKHRDATDSGCPLPTSLGELSRLPEAFHQALVEHIELLMTQLVDSPQEGDKALADIALMVGALALAKALGTGELSDRVLQAAKAAVV
ncbi:TetR/AcrR family transcriptional regulator [Pseudomonas abieticivorans]|uniref:TetR/AcrR family transcriptional regulator n=1 Tax=Pseudomonas abieticivorans TaxID=2931382 RepID=UPI0020C17743|nr:TetR/AcrR family transcriptional regulator [Pseudomonas sp. PIA16]